MAFWPSWFFILVLLLHCFDLSWLVLINPRLLCNLSFKKVFVLFYFFIIATLQIPTKMNIFTLKMDSVVLDSFIGPNNHKHLCHTVPYHAELCCPIPYHAEVCCIVPYHAELYCTVPYHTVPYYADLCCTVLYHTMLNCNVPCCTVPYHTMLNCTVL